MKTVYKHEQYGSFDAARIDKLIHSIDSLRSDMRAMQTGIVQDLPARNWFGPFGENEFDASTNSVTIEWPNLGIDLDDIERILKP